MLYVAFMLCLLCKRGITISLHIIVGIVGHCCISQIQQWLTRKSHVFQYITRTERALLALLYKMYIFCKDIYKMLQIRKKGGV